MKKKWGFAIVFAALLGAAPAPADAGEFPSLFSTVGYRSASLEALPQWRRVLDEIAREKTTYRSCADGQSPCEPRALMAWQAMIKGHSGEPSLTQLRAVNRFVNQWRAEADITNYDQQDFWSSPLTFLRRSGDCEDFAIMKYVSLREMGFEAEQLRIVIVRDLLRDLAHAVLAVNIDDEIYILDNLYQAVLPQTRVSQYMPYYSVNEEARWAHLPAESLMLSSIPWTVMPSAGAGIDAL